MNTTKNISVNLEYCSKIPDPTALLIYSYLCSVQTNQTEGTRVKQVELAQQFNTSVYKVKTAIEYLESVKLITFEQKKVEEESLSKRGVPSYIYKVVS